MFHNPCPYVTLKEIPAEFNLDRCPLKTHNISSLFVKF